MDNNEAKVLLYDIEIAPIVGTLWQKWDTNMVWMIEDWYFLCFAYKWLGEKKVHIVAQDDFKGYKPGSPNDKKVLEVLHKLMEEADIVIAHNGDRFDQKKSRARFVINDMDPVPPFQEVDTLKMAKRCFGFTSNKLDDLGEYLGLGRKIRTNMDLWRDCMAGDKKAWRDMKKYNIQDVALLEKVYLKMRPWDKQHPNMANIAGRPTDCRIGCKSPEFISAGFKYTKTGKYRRWQCKVCRAYNLSRTPEKTERPELV